MGKYRLRSKDGTIEDVGTNDKRFLIQLNGLPSGFKGTRSFLKAALQSIYSSTYHFHFKNSTKCEMMERFVTSKIIIKINDNVSRLLFLNKMMKIFEFDGLFIH